MSFSGRDTIDTAQRRHLANLGVVVSVNPIFSTATSWTWRFTRNGSWIFDIEVAERNVSRSRAAAVRRAISVLQEIADFKESRQ